MPPRRFLLIFNLVRANMAADQNDKLADDELLGQMSSVVELALVSWQDRMRFILSYETLSLFTGR